MLYYIIVYLIILNFFMPNGFLPSLSYLYKLRAIVMTLPLLDIFNVCVCVWCLVVRYECVSFKFIYIPSYIQATRYNHSITYNECLSPRNHCENILYVYLQYESLGTLNMILKLKGNDFIITLWILVFMRTYKINSNRMKHCS